MLIIQARKFLEFGYVKKWIANTIKHKKLERPSKQYKKVQTVNED